MNNIKDLRKKKGITQEELGDVIGVTKTAISYYESGKRQLTADLLQKQNRDENGTACIACCRFFSSINSGEGRHCGPDRPHAEKK